MDKFISTKDKDKILKISYLSLLAFHYGLYKRCFHLIFSPFVIFITSQLYWRNPVFYSTRYYIDVYCVKICLFYNIVTVYRYYNFYQKLIYYSIVLSGVSCYGISNKYCREDNVKLATFFHCMLHLLGNVGNIYLYNNYNTTLLIP